MNGKKKKTSDQIGKQAEDKFGEPSCIVHHGSTTTYDEKKMNERKLL